MREFAEYYYNTLSALINSINVTEKNGNVVDFYHGIEKAGNLVIWRSGSGNKLLFIGNGASAAISSHMAVDFWKNGGIRALAFNDSALLTCISNDFGYEQVFAKPIESFADKGDVLFAISSSGKSKNIISAVETARSKACYVITLSGFKEDNVLRSLGDLNFYAPCSSYGPVEVAHHSICHCMLDSIIQKKSKSKITEEKIYE